MKKLKLKAILLLITAVAILFLTNSFGINSLEQTAFVTTIGIDKSDSELEVTCSVIQKNENTAVSAKGKTFSEALEKIRLNTLKPNLSLCTSIIFGKSAYDELPALLRYLADSAVINPLLNLLVCNCETKTLLNENLAFGENIGTSIHKIINSKGKNDFSFSTAKNVLKGNIISDGFIIPYLTFTPAVPQVSLAVETLALFSDNRFQGTLTEKETKTFFLFDSKTNTRSYMFEDENFYADMNVVSKRLKRSFEAIDKLSFSAALTLTVKDSVVPPTGKNLEELLLKDLISIFNKAVSLGVDLFGFKEHAVKYENTVLKDGYLETAQILPSIKIKFITYE